MAGLGLKVVRTIAGISALATLGYGGLVLLPDIEKQLSQEDQRETALQGSGSQQSVTQPADILDCGSGDAKKLVAQLILKNPPDHLLDEAGATEMGNQKFRAQIDECYKTGGATDAQSPCVVDAAAAFNKFITAARAGAVYDLKNIRLESRDDTTGATVCNATIRADMGPDVGASEEEVSYKLEKMEDGGVHIEMSGLK